MSKPNKNQISIVLPSLLLIGAIGLLGIYFSKENADLIKNKNLGLEDIKAILVKNKKNSQIFNEIEKLKLENPDIKSQLSDTKEIQYLSRLTDKTIEREIKKDLNTALAKNNKGKLRIEIDTFDTVQDLNSEQKTALKKLDDQPQAEKIVIQFSIFDIISNNKINEFGITLDKIKILKDIK